MCLFALGAVDTTVVALPLRILRLISCTVMIVEKSKFFGNGVFQSLNLLSGDLSSSCDSPQLENAMTCAYVC